MAYAATLPAESVKLPEAYGRITAHNLIAANQIPPIAQAAVDGFALHLTNLNDSPPVHIKQYLAYGEIASEALAPGEAVGVLTGSPLPSETAAVIPHEMVQIEKDTVILPNIISPNWNIKQPGEDLSQDEILAFPGTCITAGLVSALSACGVSDLQVYRKPRIAIYGLTPNVAASPALCGPHQIPDSNGPLLDCLVNRDGGTVVGHFFPWTNSTISEYPLEQADIIITVGGTYASGESEAVKLLRQWQATPLFWGVKMQPGSHTGAGIYHNIPVICLAGNPAACAVGYELLAAPAIRQMQGLNYIRPQVSATCVNSFVSSQSSTPRFLRGKADCTDDGWFVEILTGQKASMIRSLIDCNVLIEIPSGQSELRAGSKVSLLLLGQYPAISTA